MNEVQSVSAPDGTIRVDLEWVEWFNSHWVRSPRVIAVASGRILLDLWGGDWDAVPSFPGASRVRLEMRRYHHGGSLTVEIDLTADHFWIVEEAGPPASLAGIAAGLEAASVRAAAAAPRRAAIPAPKPARGKLLLILVGALVAIAAGTVVSLYLFPQEPAKLDKLPPMPPVR